MDLAEAPRGRSQHPETARPEGSSLRRTLRGTRQRQDRRQGPRSSPKGPVPGRRRRREPEPPPRREQVLSASSPPSPRREPTPSASPTPSARREQVLSASPAPSPRREPTPFASPAPPPRREPTLFASPAPPPRREPTLFASPAPPPRRREPAPCGRASRRSPRRRLLTAGPRLGQRGSSASAVSWMSACPRVLLDVHCASDIRMRCRRSAPAVHGPSRLTTRGVTDGTPSANSPAKERFTNSGAPTM